MFRRLRGAFIPSLISLLCFGQSNHGQPVPSPTPVTAGNIVSLSPQTVSFGQSAGTSVSDSSVALSSMPNLLGQAIALYRKGDFDAALAKYQAVLQEKPKSPDALAGIIRIYLKQKKVDQASHAADQALALSDAPRIRVAHGEVLFRQGRIDEADKEWVGVVNSGYPEARAYLGLARVYRAAAMYKSAEKMILKAHTIDPTDPDIQRRWMGTLSRSERIKYLEDALAGENNWDAEERENTAEYLQYLKERAKRKVPPCRLVSKVTATEAPLVRLMSDPKHLRGYGLSVVLNGHKNSLMLDTGASGIVVRRGIAEKAGISKVTATKIGGIGDKGRKNAYIGIADSVKIGDLEFQHCPIEVIESRSVVDEDGLIGTDVFEDFLVDIDFPDEKLRLGELPRRPGESELKPALKDEEDDPDDAQAAESSDNSEVADAKNSAPLHRPGPQDRYIAPEMQSYTRVLRFGHQLLVPTKIGDVPPKLFILDTGAFSNSISPAAAREVTKVHGDSDTTVKGISGTMDKVYSANKAVLQFGRLRQENQGMIGFDTTPLSESTGTEVAGFLGFAMLRFLEIKIDYRDALVDFSYDRNRWH
jgi:tetratricopeptide (TPR) repeat protein